MISPFESKAGSFLVGNQVPVVVPARTAAEWVNATRSRVHTAAGSAGMLLVLATPGTRSRLLAALARREVTADDVAHAMGGALEQQIPGSPGAPLRWWESYRLLDLSASASIAGRMVLAGVDPHRLTPAAWCYAVLEEVTRGMDEKQRFRFDAELSVPPPGVEDDDMSWGAMSFDEMVAQARNTPGMR